MSNRESQYGQKDTYDKLFEKCKTVPGKNTDLYRQDVYGNTIHRTGTKETPKAHKDHIKPSSLGGSDNIRNVQLLHPSKNCSLGNSEVKRSRHSECNRPTTITKLKK